VRTASNRTDRILDECLASIVEKGRTVEDCLALYPGQKESLEPELRLALRLRSARILQPSPEFKRSASARLRHLAAASSRLPPGGWVAAASAGAPSATVQLDNLLPRRRGFFARLPLRRPSFLTRGQPRHAALWLRAACLALILLVLTTLGTVGASAQSLPGDWLYPVKLAQESFRLTLAADDANQARLRLSYANQRLEEVAALLEKNRTTGLDQALDNYNSQIQAELDYLGEESSLTSSEQTGLAQSVLSDVAAHQTRLATLTQGAPLTAQVSLAAALAVSQKAYSRAEQIIQSPGSGNSGAAVTSTLTPEPSSTPTPPTQKATPTPSPSSTPDATQPAPAQVQPTGSQGGSGTPKPTAGVKSPPVSVKVSATPTLTSTPPLPNSVLPTLNGPKASPTLRQTGSPGPGTGNHATATRRAPYP
jgi:hypothetical protein